MQRVTLFLVFGLAVTVGAYGQGNAPVTDVVVPTAVAPERVPTAQGPPVTVPGPLPLGTPAPITPGSPALSPDSQSIQMVITVPTNVPPPPPTNMVTPVPAHTAAPAPTAESPGQPTDYTVKSGDSLWKIGRKFGVPVDVILQANSMKSDRLQIGQVLKIPPKQVKAVAGEAAPIAAPAAPAPLQPGQYMVKQGDTLWDIARAHDIAVQDLREANKLRNNALQIGQILTMPKGKGATGSGGGTGRAASKQPAIPSPLVTPPPDAPAPPPHPPALPNPTPPPQPTPPRTPQPSPLPLNPPTPIPQPQPAPLPLPPGAQFDHGRTQNGNIAAALFQETDSLVSRRIRYAQRWRPPGERQAWVMDCSNTSRYLYRRVAGIDIGRTASDQYYFLNQRHLAWRIPSHLQGDALTRYLAQRMQPGDLLFWEHTYKPKRNPPVTHVMVYLGRSRGGDLLMAGSQSHGSGMDTRIVGGPDIYVFDPTAPAGGYSSWLGMGRINGRFVAYGRPLALRET